MTNDLAQRACRAAQDAIARALADGDAAFAEALLAALEGLAADPPDGPAWVDPDYPSAVDGPDYVKAPFSWFGGKQFAADLVWRALGDVAHYVEPFCGSLAVLLRRPHLANRAYYSETVNDIDHYLVNAWRAMLSDPVETARWASWPVAEAEVMARHLWLLRWSAEHADRVCADPGYYDARAAGYWLYGVCAWIGPGWCSGDGPWVVGEHGGIVRRSSRAEPGVTRQLPHLGDNGRGVHHASTREPGVTRQLPHLGDNGMGVHRPQLREPGVRRQLPHLGGNGRGVHHASTREPGVGEHHPMTMPQLVRWFQYLAARLRHVRIVNGDWRRVLTGGALKTLSVRQGKGVCGVFLDPPYTPEVLRDKKSALYLAHGNVAADVRAWCLANGDDPQYRIVLAGFAGEGHEELERHGWRCVPWFQDGFLRGGYAQQSDLDHQQHRERLWLSPHCLPIEDDEPEPEPLPLFAYLDSLGCDPCGD